MKKSVICLFLVLGTITVLANAKEVFRKGNWAVQSNVDPMTDRQWCFAVYLKKNSIQASKDNFYISMKGRGGVESYQVRIDDHAAAGVMPAMDDERDLSLVKLAYYFPEIYEGKRLRIQIRTILNDIVTEDIDLNGFRESVDFTKGNGCA